jgi:hypothetical protein
MEVFVVVVIERVGKCYGATAILGVTDGPSK